MTNTTRTIGRPRQDPVGRVAAGVKTALIVCVVGFIALVANRALVSPHAVGADGMAAPAMPAAELRAPASSMQANDYVLPAPAASAESATPSDGGDNHPASF